LKGLSSETRENGKANAFRSVEGIIVILDKRQENSNFPGVDDLGTLHVDILRQLGISFRFLLNWGEKWRTSDNKVRAVKSLKEVWQQ